MGAKVKQVQDLLQHPGIKGEKLHCYVKTQYTNTVMIPLILRESMQSPKHSAWGWPVFLLEADVNSNGTVSR